MLHKLSSATRDTITIAMTWPTAEALVITVPLPDGYRYEMLRRSEVPALINALDDWFPGLAVGNASCFLREDFYADRVFFEGHADHDFFVLLFKRGDDWAGVLSVERDKDSQVLYGRVGAISKRHRGAGLSKVFPSLMEAMGNVMGMGMAYGLATLKVPNMQVSFEKAGWQLIGIIPGFDRELIGPGQVKRVFEAIYVKVLVAESEFLRPSVAGMTPMTNALFNFLYPQCRIGAQPGRLNSNLREPRRYGPIFANHPSGRG
jgi:hypothetical protein